MRKQAAGRALALASCGVMFPLFPSAALAAAGAQGGGSALPQLDPSTYPGQLFWLGVVFGALLLVMWRVALPRVAETLERRQKKLEGDLARAEDLRDQIAALEDSGEASLRGARERARDILRQAAADSAREHEARMKVLEADLTARGEVAARTVADARAAALAEIESVAADAAAAAVEALCRTPADSARVRRAVADARAGGEG